MLRLIYIGAGSAIGGVLRYVVTGATHRVFSGEFPSGTMVINLSGSLIIGFLWGMFEAAAVSRDVRMFFLIGVLGSFTTFSTFSLENMNLFLNREYGYFLMNIFVTVILGIAVVFIGFSLSRQMLA
ncbi:MAG: fluoride efflux transporter CrcB [Candidatus Aminicenantes bacterium]|nr:fluoride efflux transporter CrcB [Candidatus Aminicenantes bacterium]